MQKSVIVGIAGELFRLLAAYWGMQPLLAASPANLPRMNEIQLDWRVFPSTNPVMFRRGSRRAADGRPGHQLHPCAQGDQDRSSGRSALRIAISYGSRQQPVSLDQ